MTSSDARLFSPSTARNHQPILAVLQQKLPAEGLLLEVASGSGEHGALFAPQVAPLVWQPSDPDPACRASIAGHAAAAACGNLSAPLDLDVCSPDWPLDRADVVICCNMVHISPWAATEGLLAGAGRILPRGGWLYLYGPFKRAGVPTAPSNESFDQSLRARNPEWGIRDLEAVSAQAAAEGLALQEVVEMPANNLSVWFQKT